MVVPSVQRYVHLTQNRPYTLSPSHPHTQVLLLLDLIVTIRRLFQEGHCDVLLSSSILPRCLALMGGPHLHV
jgi:hypothetical protein